MNTYTFISYQTADKSVAGKIQQVLKEVGVKSFLAHEDIEVSKEWRTTILEEIARAAVFVCVLSKSYYESEWCVQESGIAAYRDNMTIIPLSLDGSIPKGFVGHIQSTAVRPESLTIDELLPGFMRHDRDLGVDIIVKKIAASSSFRAAEANFERMLPHLAQLTGAQMKELLEESAANTQVCHASRCARHYIPPLLKKHGHLLSRDVRKSLKDICALYT